MEEFVLFAFYASRQTKQIHPFVFWENLHMARQFAFLFYLTFRDTQWKKCGLTKYPRYFTIYSAFLPKSVICLGCFRKKLCHMSIVHVQIHYFCHFVEVSCKDIVAHQFTDFFCLHYSTFE